MPTACQKVIRRQPKRAGLQNVLRIARAGDVPADEIAQPGLLSTNRFREPLVLFRHQPVSSQRLVHPSV